MSIMNISWG